MTIQSHPDAASIASSVDLAEYQRLLGLPKSRVLEGELLDRAQGAHNWYANHGDPFIGSERIELETVHESSVALKSGLIFTSRVLADRLRHGEAHGLMVLAATAGRAVADEVAKHWSDGRPDEAYFLDRFAVAVTESLVFQASTALCRHSEHEGETLLPHLSPGCGHWDLSDQHKVMSVLAGEEKILGPITLMDSGALHPQHSVLAVLGITRRNFSVTPKDLCRSCDHHPCSFRRAPYTSRPGGL